MTNREQKTSAWKRFEKTGEVGAYLLYCSIQIEENAPPSR